MSLANTVFRFNVWSLHFRDVIWWIEGSYFYLTVINGLHFSWPEMINACISFFFNDFLMMSRIFNLPIHWVIDFCLWCEVGIHVHLLPPTLQPHVDMSHRHKMYWIDPCLPEICWNYFPPCTCLVSVGLLPAFLCVPPFLSLWYLTVTMANTLVFISSRDNLGGLSLSSSLDLCSCFKHRLVTWLENP